jgi:hypothetical protein
MTVEAPLTATPAGSTEIIQGTVTDQSPGALAYAKKYDVTNGVAAVSDNDQEAWMEYIYEQQAKPTNATGVPVSIDAIDPNGNTIHIGDATSDTSGSYIYSWTTPNVPGQYKIIASFEGSNSYGSSYAQTGAYVSSEQSAVTTSPIPVASQQPVEMYVIGIGIALAIIIAIGFAITIIVLRKRP